MLNLITVKNFNVLTHMEKTSAWKIQGYIDQIEFQSTGKTTGNIIIQQIQQTSKNADHRLFYAVLEGQQLNLPPSFCTIHRLS